MRFGRIINNGIFKNFQEIFLLKPKPALGIVVEILFLGWVRAFSART
jgi:hypothetical protein